MIRRTRIAICASAVMGYSFFGGTGLGVGQTRREQSEVKPNPAIQTQLNALAAALAMKSADDPLVRLGRSLSAIDKVAGGNTVELMRQLIWQKSRSTDVATGMVLHLVVQHLGVDEFQMVDAMADLLDSPDQRVRSAAEEVADMIERRPSAPILFLYQSYLEGLRDRSLQPGAGLVRRMYSLDPGLALQTFLEVYAKENKEIRWAEKTVRDYLWKKQYGFLENGEAAAEASEQLAILSKRPEWWARLYVAHTYRTVPELRSEEAIARLKDDTDPFVKEAMQLIGVVK